MGDTDSGPIPFSTTSAEDRRRLWQAFNHNEARIEDLEQHLPRLVQDTIRAAMPSSLLSDEEHQWIKLAIERESQVISFRRAVIEKTVGGLIWALIAGFCTLGWVMLKEFFAGHGWKP